MMAQQLARSIAWSIVVLMCCAVGRVAGQTGSIDAATAAPLRYRRVYVPKEKLKEFTRGHMPLKREEFPKLVDRIDAHAEATHSDMAWIQSADYSAIFSNGQLESGLAQVHVVHTGVGATVLPLSPCALAMGPATWQGAESIRGAVVGSDLKGNLGVGSTGIGRAAVSLDACVGKRTSGVRQLRCPLASVADEPADSRLTRRVRIARGSRHHIPL